MPQDVSLQYRACLAARQATRDRLNDSDARFAHARLAAFGAAVLMGAFIWRGSLAIWWLILPVVAFAWLVRRHDRVLRARAAAVRGIEFYERGLARIEDRWAGTGEPGERFRDDRHVYANDLDLFGRGSLFELLSLARTRAGEATLAAWLTSPADAAEIRTRQQAVEELAPALDLREQLALAGADLRQGVHTDRLLEWAEAPMPPTRAIRVFTWLFTVAAAVLIALGSAWLPLAVLAALEAVVFRRLGDAINAILSGRDPDETATFVADALTHRARDLGVIADVLRTLEAQRFSGDRLRQLQARFTTEGVPASRIIRRLQRCAELHDSSGNAALLPLGLFLLGQLELSLAIAALLQLLRPHLTLVVDRWRRRYGRQVRAWLDGIAQVEALTSLSAYRHEHVADRFPEIVTDGGALFEGVQLGHPMLPAGGMVRNDVRLGGRTQLLVVSGSNMSGKSTLLRTVGVNAVMALAGAPVRAESLRLSPLAIGATLRIQDSLLEGRSRFYAEITRVRQLADIAAGPVPLLFLLDELFHGTNSHDRRTGASGVLRSLLDRGAIGLITTHDLALTSVADELSPRAANVHFEDWFEEGDMRFDYLMKSGPVTRSNALALMRAVGLDVPGPA